LHGFDKACRSYFVIVEKPIDREEGFVIITQPLTSKKKDIKQHNTQEKNKPNRNGKQKH